MSVTSGVLLEKTLQNTKSHAYSMVNDGNAPLPIFVGMFESLVPLRLFRLESFV